MENSWNIYKQYVNIMTDYLLHYTSSNKFQKKESDHIYLLQHGFSTLTHIFKITLREKLHVNEAMENTKKGIMYYTEFIEQMEENSMYDLNISSVNAAAFVFKKTIADIKVNDKDDKSVVNNSTIKKIKNFEHLLIIHRDLFEILTLYGYNSTIPDKLMDFAFEFCMEFSDNETNVETLTIKEDILTKQLSNIIIFMNHFPEYDKDLYRCEHYLYDYIQVYVKKYKHIHLSIEQVYIKKASPDYYLRLHNDSIKKYIKWLVL
jgi:hypothetical protein